MPTVTADELYRFILENAEKIDGRLVCRVSLAAELRKRGVKEGRQQLRFKLVRELEAQGLIKRAHPQSGHLVILQEPASDAPEPNRDSRSRLTERMSAGNEPGAIEIHSVPHRRFEHDPALTRGRIARLRRYVNKNVLAGTEFICSNWGECETSIGANCTFQKGFMSHVGKHYDVRAGEKDLRVVVVGQEVGKSKRPHMTLDERYRGIHLGSGLGNTFHADGEHKGRNPHMRGTTLALRTIFQTGSGVDKEGEFIDIDGERVHLFDCFALVNRLLCSAHLAGTSNGKSTSTMLNNCERHFAATLEILQPTVVVIQGVRMWKWSQKVLVPSKQVTDHLVEASLGNEKVAVATFTHPSAHGEHRWGSPSSPYFIDVVEPTLRRAIKLSP